MPLNHVSLWRISDDNPITYVSTIDVEPSDKHAIKSDNIRDLKIHPTLPILAVIQHSNIVKIYMFSHDGNQIELIETFNNGDSIVGSISFHPTEPILATGSAGKTIKFWNCDLLSVSWHKKNALTHSGIASTLIDRLTALPKEIWQHRPNKLKLESAISERIGSIPKDDPNKVSKLADRFEEIGPRDPMEEVDGGARLRKYNI
jgi:WD40 repeat protein